MAKVIIEGAPLSKIQNLGELDVGAWFTLAEVVMMKVACEKHSVDDIVIQFGEDGVEITKCPKCPRGIRVVPIKGPDEIVVRWED